MGSVGKAAPLHDRERQRADLLGDAGLPVDVKDVSGALGRGGYEGIQNDSDGNLWIVEDIGGSNKPGTTAKIPNSFLYRYPPPAGGWTSVWKLKQKDPSADHGRISIFYKGDQAHAGFDNSRSSRRT